MGVHDLGFRGYEGERSSLLARIYALAKSDVRKHFKSWKFLIFYALCIAPALMGLFVVYIQFVVFEGQGQAFGLERFRGRMMRGGGFFGRALDDIHFYFDLPLAMGMLFTLVFSALVGATLISQDRKSGALEIYFTRGIRPIHYFLGKWGAAAFLMASQMILPYLVVWISAVFMAPDWGYLERTAAFMPRLVLALGLFCATMSFLVAAQSVSTNSPAFSVIRWVGGIFVLWSVAFLFRRVFQENEWLAISPWNVVKRVSEAIADVEAGRSFDLSYALVSFVVLILLGTYWLRRHLRPVEVIG